MSTDLSPIQDLLSRYVAQLLHGCGHSECCEPMCDTGRRNIYSGRPVRTYTPRSARAIALALVARPSPRKHLCVRRPSPASTHEVQSTGTSEVEGARDPSSLEQLLCDTPSIRNLCEPLTDIAVPATGFQHHHRALQPLLQPVSTERELPRTLINNEDAATLLVNALLACLGTVPPGTAMQYAVSNEYIRDGRASPSILHNNVKWTCDDWDVPVKTLDSFERGQSLMSQICEAIAIRFDMEDRLCQRRRSLGKGRAERAKRLLPTIVRKLDDIADVTVILTLVWLSKTFMMAWEGKASVPPNSTAAGALLLKQSLYDESNARFKTAMTQWTKTPAFIESLTPVKIAEDWTASLDKGKGNAWASINDARCPRHSDEVPPPHHDCPITTPHELRLLSFDFMFEPAERALYFRTINHLRMRRAHSAAEKAVELRRRVAAQTFEHEPGNRVQHAEAQYLLLNVSRNNVLQDAYDQLWQRRAEELFRPLRVRLGEVDELEVGHDLGGVQIEFFNLVCKTAFAEDAGLFVTKTTTGISYFRPGSLQPLYMFELLGLLFALAMYNGITLPVSFPQVFYTLLLGGHNPTMDELSDGWPEEAKSFEYIIHTEGAEADLEYTFPIEANGVRLFVLDPLPTRDIYGPASETAYIWVTEAVPTTYPSSDIILHNLNWPGIEFVDDNCRGADPVAPNVKERYVSEYASWLAFGSVAPQLRAFQRGFFRVIDRHTLSVFLKPQNLKAFMEGSTHLDIKQLRKATRYDNYDPKSNYIAGFWRMLESWPEEKQKQLLKFVTAAERVPLGGPGHLRFVIQRAHPMTDAHLPTSSTCFGTLQLPLYPDIETLEEKLSLAIKYGLEGFGTG